jgi:hypothetical protein
MSPDRDLEPWLALLAGLVAGALMGGVVSYLIALWT